MVSFREIHESLPEDFEALLLKSIEEDYKFLQRLKDEWETGTNKFSKHGERLVGIFSDNKLVAIGGINIDPYLQGKNGRIRHLYVHKDFRRKGLATIIMQELEKKASGYFTSLTLRTDNPKAAIFYELLGFEKINNNDFITHKKTL